MLKKIFFLIVTSLLVIGILIINNNYQPEVEMVNKKIEINDKKY